MMGRIATVVLAGCINRLRWTTQHSSYAVPVT